MGRLTINIYFLVIAVTVLHVSARPAEHSVQGDEKEGGTLIENGDLDTLQAFDNEDAFVGQGPDREKRQAEETSPKSEGEVTTMVISVTTPADGLSTTDSPESQTGGSGSDSSESSDSSDSSEEDKKKKGKGKGKNRKKDKKNNKKCKKDKSDGSTDSLVSNNDLVQDENTAAEISTFD